MTNELFKFIETSPTAFHAVENIKTRLLRLGFEELSEGQKWNIESGKSYFLSRNMSSLVAFRVPEGDFQGFMIAASHSDSPAMMIKENAELKDKHYVRLSAERYGGMINSTWLDRALSIAGRVLLRTESGVTSRLVDISEPAAIIPNVAIHMNRKINEGVALNPAVDMLPLYALGDEKISLKARIAKMLGVNEEDILSSDLLLYNRDKGADFGDFISAPRLDDLQCVFASLKAFESAENFGSMPVLAVFDNEEIGSKNRHGADSDFLRSTLGKVLTSLSLDDFEEKMASSFMMSCDNAHAVHPNHPELSDSNHQVCMNGGVVIKCNANQQYTTDGISSSLAASIFEKALVPYQYYYNRADIPGGSTLGNIANAQLAVLSADIGLAQLSMHSALETAGKKDTEYMIKALKAFFETTLKFIKDGEYELR